MRRAPAILLIALFSFSLISPALFASDPDAKLPACCRIAGKHHCRSIAMLMTPSGPSLETGECSVFPIVKTASTSPVSGVACAAPAVFSLEAGSGFAGPRSESVDHSSYSRAGQKRGPPSTIG